MAIMKFYTVPMFLHAVTTVVNQKAFSSKHVSFFYCENMTSFLYYATATLRALFAWRGSYGSTRIIRIPDLFIPHYTFIHNK